MRPACARLKTRHPLKTDSYIKKCRPVYVCMCTVANCDSEPFLFFFFCFERKEKWKKRKTNQNFFSALAFFFYFQVISRGLYSIAEMITSSCLLWSLDVVLYFSTVFFFFFIAFSLFIRFCVDDVQSFVDDVLSLVFPPPSQMFDFSAENRFRFYYSRAPAHNTHWYQCLHKHIQLYLVLFVSSSDVCIILYLSNLRRLKKKFCLLLSLNLVYMIHLYITYWVFIAFSSYSFRFFVPLIHIESGKPTLYGRIGLVTFVFSYLFLSKANDQYRLLYYQERDKVRRTNLSSSLFLFLLICWT